MKAALAAVLIATLPALARAGALDEAFCPPGDSCRMASATELEALRGGFDLQTPGGRLTIDIGITRTVALNDRTVAVSRLTVDGAALVVQSGPGNFAPMAFPAHAIPTLVQNTLDHQKIATLTVVSAAVNSVAVLGALRLGEALARATAASGR